VLLIIACQHNKVLDKIGTVPLAFACGILLASCLDLGALLAVSDLVPIQTQLSEVAIALAIPLMVFSVNVKAAIEIAGPTLKAMFFALLAVSAIGTLLSLVFESELSLMWQIAGMTVGAYTGGGPNMAAIKTAIDGDQSLFVTMTSYDILLSAMFLLFVMTVAKPLASTFLHPFSQDDNRSGQHDSHRSFEHMADESAHAFKTLYKKGAARHCVLSIVLAALVVGASVGIAGLLPEAMQSTATIILISSIGVLCAFIPFVNALTTSFQSGMYFVLVFCFTMGAMTDVSIFASLNWALFFYILCVLVGAFVVQAILCKFTRVDADTFLITLSAAVMSVPFIPVIAGALKNRALLLPGFAAAILGYVAGNYLGIFTAYLVRALTT